MSGTLLKRELKINGKLLALFLAVLTLYGGMITSMFDPKLGESLNAMAASMPALFASLGSNIPTITAPYRVNTAQKISRIL